MRLLRGLAGGLLWIVAGLLGLVSLAAVPDHHLVAARDSAAGTITAHDGHGCPADAPPRPRASGGGDQEGLLSRRTR